MEERSKIFGIITLVVAILFFTAGICMGFLGKSFSGDFNFLMAFITWVSGAPVVFAFYALYVHIDNQETLIWLTGQQNQYMKEIAQAYTKDEPSDKSSDKPSNANASNAKMDLHTIVNGAQEGNYWICRNCDSKNPANVVFCRDCGTPK